MNITWCFVLILLAVSHQPSLALNFDPETQEGRVEPRSYACDKPDTREPSEPLRSVSEGASSATRSVTAPAPLPIAIEVSPSPQEVSSTPAPTLTPAPAPVPNIAPEASTDEPRAIQPESAPVSQVTSSSISEKVDRASKESLAPPPTIPHVEEEEVTPLVVVKSRVTSSMTPYPYETLQDLIPEASQSTGQGTVPAPTHQAATKSPHRVVQALIGVIRGGNADRYSRFLSLNHQVLPRDEADNVLGNIARKYRKSGHISTGAYFRMRQITQQIYPRQESDKKATYKYIDEEFESTLELLTNYGEQLEKLLRENPKNTDAIQAREDVKELKERIGNAFAYLDEVEDILKLPSFMTLAQHEIFEMLKATAKDILTDFDTFEEAYVESGILEEAQMD